MILHAKEKFVSSLDYNSKNNKCNLLGEIICHKFSLHDYSAYNLWI